jgi:hypothetical protein
MRTTGLLASAALVSSTRVSFKGADTECHLSLGAAGTLDSDCGMTLPGGYAVASSNTVEQLRVETVANITALQADMAALTAAAAPPPAPGVTTRVGDHLGIANFRFERENRMPGTIKARVASSQGWRSDVAMVQQNLGVTIDRGGSYATAHKSQSGGALAFDVPAEVGTTFSIGYEATGTTQDHLLNGNDDAFAVKYAPGSTDGTAVDTNDEDGCFQLIKFDAPAADVFKVQYCRPVALQIPTERTHN